MKLQFKKAVAATLALSMCMPATVFAAEATSDKAGSFETSFDIYSPKLNISVPLKADVLVNPMADSSATTVDKFTVASNSLDIMNATVDTEVTNGKGIPVNVTVNASISKKGEDVETLYNTLTANNTSTKKKINLNLTEGSGATLDRSAIGAMSDNTKWVDLSTVSIDQAASYDSATNKTPVTAFGSQLSVDIAAPTTSGTDLTDTSTVTPAVGSFAITGEAYTNADWKKDDIELNITYNVKASGTLGITTPTVAGKTSTDGAAVKYEITGAGEATILAVVIHNDGEGGYGDFIVENWVPTYNADGSIDLEIPANHPTLSFLASDASGCNGKAQDLIIGLSDGRRIVTTLTSTTS